MPPPPSSDPLKTFATLHSGDAFRVLVEAHAGVVTGVAHRITGSRETAEEVTQDVFTLLARRAVALARGDAPLAAWLHRTATYMALNARKREKRRHSMLERAMHELSQAADPPADTPEWMPHLDAALNTLTAPDRQLLLLHHAAGYSLPEAAAQLGLSTEAVKKRSQRAMERLRTVMQRIRSGAEGPTGPQGPPMTDTPVPVTACLATAFLPAAISPAKAASIAARALTASKTAGSGAVLLNVLHTMNYTKAAAAIAACIALVNLGWQQYEITTARREVETLRKENAPPKSPPSSSAVVSVPAAKPATNKPASNRIEFAELAAMFEAMANNDRAIPNLKLFAIMETMREEDARRLLETSRTASISPEVRDSLRDSLLSILAQTDPAGALRMSMEFWEAASGRQAARMLQSAADHFSAWLEKDTPAALKWLEEAGRSGVLASRSVSGSSPLRIMRGSAVLTLASTAPDQADALLANLPPDEKRATLAQAAQCIQPSDDWKPMLALLMKVPADVRAQSVNALASIVGIQSIDEVLKLVSSAELPPADTALALASGISETSREKPLNHSLEWLAKHVPEGTVDAAHVKFLTSGGAWYHTAEAVPAFAGFIQRGIATDKDTAAFLESAVDPELRPPSMELLQMAAGIKDESIRREAANKLVTAWAKRDASAAAAAVQKVILPDEEKAALLKATGR